MHGRTERLRVLQYAVAFSLLALIFGSAIASLPQSDDLPAYSPWPFVWPIQHLLDYPSSVSPLVQLLRCLCVLMAAGLTSFSLWLYREKMRDASYRRVLIALLGHTSSGLCLMALPASITARVAYVLGVYALTGMMLSWAFYESRKAGQTTAIGHPSAALAKGLSARQLATLSLSFISLNLLAGHFLSELRSHRTEHTQTLVSGWLEAHWVAGAVGSIGLWFLFLEAARGRSMSQRTPRFAPVSTFARLARSAWGLSVAQICLGLGGQHSGWSPDLRVLHGGLGPVLWTLTLALWLSLPYPASRYQTAACIADACPA